MVDRKPRKTGTIELIRYSLKNINWFRAVRQREKTRKPLFLAYRELSKLDIDDPILARRIEEYNQGVVDYYSGKFLASEASRTGNKQLWKRAFNGFNNGRKMGQMLLKALNEGSTKPIPMTQTPITDNGTEIKFAHDVPLVPEITPVIVIKGSDYEMGYQYAQQLVQIYGPWILEMRAGRKFSEQQIAELRKWEEQHRLHTPWLIEFVKGWTQGAIDSGIPMSYDDIMYLWVGDQPASYDFLSQDGLPEIPPMACSGMAAWGRATKDGKLVTGSTGDHDLSYQVIIVAYPDDGNAFIYSAFGATGAIAGGGDFWFFGHPAMNSKGVAYVHHGGGPKFLEPKKYWGYGVRRAASVMHIMRYAETAEQALDMEMSMPIGDIGKGDQGTVGGFYADDNYGYVIEGRKEPVAIREAGLMGETDFLYANNSAIHPRAIESEWMSSSKDGWKYDPHGGWRPKTPTGLTKSIGVFLQWASGRLSTSDMMIRGMMMSYDNSADRNLYMFNMLDSGKGKIDSEYMKMMYRIGGKLPEGPFDKIVKDYQKTGNWGIVTTAHASNAITTVMKPSDGLFSLCTGPAKAGMKPLFPGSIIPIYRETNAFFEIKLDETPEYMVEYAQENAEQFISQAETLLNEVSFNENTMDLLRSYLSMAKQEYSKGLSKGSDLYDTAKSLRAFTRAQVRARQVINAINPPPSSPEELH
jgi:hypothetical protein